MKCNAMNHNKQLIQPYVQQQCKKCTVHIEEYPHDCNFLPYSTKFWQDKTLMNWHRKNFGEENFSEFAPLLHPVNRFCARDIQTHNYELSQ